MEHQDFNEIKFHNKKDSLAKENKKKVNSNKIKDPEKYKIEVPSNLKTMISESRNILKLKQSELSQKMGISVLVLQKWENGKIIPSNLEISNLEKILKVKLPRSKKVPID